MRFRLTQPNDFGAARDLVPAGYRYSSKTREALPRIWTELLRAGALNTAVVEDPALPQPERLRGVGLSVFVTDDFADEALRLREPYLNARLHEMILGGRSPVLTQAEIAKGNTNGGLTLMPLHFATRSLDIGIPDVMRTLTAAQDLFRLVHAGCRVKRVIKDVVNIDLCRFMQSSGMRLVTDYKGALPDSADLDPHQRPYLLAAEHAELALGTTMSMMFITGEVRFRFSPAEQRLLQCALYHEHDEDVAADLVISLDTLRKHWRSIYQRVQFADPLFFPDEPDRNGRGRGKRRHLLRYLTLHMEELRPYRERAASRAGRDVARRGEAAAGI
jgi:hypothetical protein